ncbi:MAG: sigma-70 family RNA polymerase sigma factor [Planctomycetes bacterium]|nr:sigma-70 family RNA polymerase sigma factor [Planctomycetota bacterium]
MTTTGAGEASGFRPTRWSLVARAGDGDPAARQRALGELCELYWPPLYAWLRRSGHAEAAALDLVQSFCTELLDGGTLRGADAGRGPFRHYLLGALRHFVANTQRRNRAGKRGGGALHWSLDAAETRYAPIAARGDDPERAFERAWAQALLDRAATRLRREYAERGRAEVLAALEPWLLGHDDAARQAEIAARLGCSEGAVKVAVFRLRARMRELVRDEVLQTVGDTGAVDDELRQLMAALTG